MQLKCVAIDDEPLALELIKNYVLKYPSLQMVQTFEDAVSGAEYIRQHPVDLLFLDINMPDITGIDLARGLENPPMIIFTTAYKNFAFEGFELEAIDYLLKPIDIKRFGKAVEKALDYHKYKNAAAGNQDDESLYVYSEYRMVKISLRDIEYIESMEDYIKIHLQFSKTILTLMPLKRVLEKLPADKFQRIHRSYIIPVGKIISMQNRRVKLSSIELPISDTYSNFARQWMGR